MGMPPLSWAAGPGLDNSLGPPFLGKIEARRSGRGWVPAQCPECREFIFSGNSTICKSRWRQEDSQKFPSGPSVPCWGHCQPQITNSPCTSEFFPFLKSPDIFFTFFLFSPSFPFKNCQYFVGFFFFIGILSKVKPSSCITTQSHQLYLNMKLVLWSCECTSHGFGPGSSGLEIFWCMKN